MYFSLKYARLDTMQDNLDEKDVFNSQKSQANTQIEDKKHLSSKTLLLPTINQTRISQGFLGIRRILCSYN